MISLLLDTVAMSNGVPHTQAVAGPKTLDDVIKQRQNELIENTVCCNHS